ncbi:MAG: HAMP domain-containing histidine kinase [Deltaproteobacteria bacterium]|nr:HAMP domain-containing histidine kinase [Deltaproteobacteria bacterium]
MRRLRIAFVLLALALAVPLALLVSRALASVALERATQHRAVAERVFDEMERALSRFLEREEERPFEEYRAALPRMQRPAPSPAPASAEPFLMGHFQIEPDGSFGTPELSGADRDGNAMAGKKRAGLDSAAKIEELVLRAWAIDRRERLPAVPEAADDEVPPGATVERGRRAQKRDELAMKELGQQDEEVAKSVASSERGSAFELLSSLNRAGEERAERKQKVTQAPYADVYGQEVAGSAARARFKASGRVAPAPPPSDQDVAAAKGRLASSEARGTYAFEGPQRSSVDFEGARAIEKRIDSAQRRSSGEPLTVAAAAPAPAPAGAMAAALGDELARAASPDAARFEAEADMAAARILQREVSITLDPMVGRRIDERYIVLSRTVLVGEQGYRQGFLVDTEALGQWLEERVLGINGLAQLGHTWFLGPGEATPARSAAQEFVYEHRFAEPFDSLRVLLALEPLPGTASTRTIYQLAGLVALLALGGLAAVYRMVAVVVSYAERRNQFVAAVSHELKTPLTSIRMYSEMLRDGVVPEGRQREDYYATIHSESERLSRLIDNVLEFSRLERGSREFDFTVGDVAPVVREAVETLRPHVEREGFSLTIALEGDLPPVRFDRDAVLQVLFNLVDNALKYAHSASQREIAITCLRDDEGVALCVRDFGPGVPRRHHARIFEAFYRGENELTRSAKGSGIGLALVKELAEAMGAPLQSGNAEGGGFRVSLRFVPAR